MPPAFEPLDPLVPLRQCSVASSTAGRGEEGEETITGAVTETETEDVLCFRRGVGAAEETIPPANEVGVEGGGHCVLQKAPGGFPGRERDGEGEGGCQACPRQKSCSFLVEPRLIPVAREAARMLLPATKSGATFA